ncbi:MAG: hypothetical protein RL398_439 [Planctomycetota bacterium]|jgi:hypothetical protein
MRRPLLALCALLPSVAVAQGDPTEILATFKLADKTAYVTRTDVALEMAFHLRRRDEGRQAVDVLVESELTRRAAVAKGVMPSTAELRSYWDGLQQQLRAAGRNPQDIAAVRNMTEAQLFEYLAVQMAQERLVRKELALKANDAVSGDMIKLWLQEERKRSKIETNPDRLPAGTACLIDDQPIAIDQLGNLLLRTSDEEQITEFVQQVAFLLSVEEMARNYGVTLAAEDLDAAIAARRADAAKDARYRGMSFEQLLESQGLTVAALRDLRVFRAKTMLPLLAAKRTPDAELRRSVREDRSAVLDRVGPRRRIGVIFVRAAETPNALIPNDFAAAEAKLVAAKARIAKDGFALVARIESDEPLTKQRGGDTGWHNKQGANLPQFLVDAAYALAVGEVSAPLRGDDGCYLVSTLEAEPDLDDEQLVARLRERAADDLKKQIVEGLQLQRGNGETPTKK